MLSSKVSRTRADIRAIQDVGPPSPEPAHVGRLRQFSEELNRDLDPRPLVSIVAPFYNERDSLQLLTTRLRAVCETLALEYRFEYVLVDDGSTDGSLSIAVASAATEPRLRVIELRRNYGQTAALQAGLDAAAGDIIISMDADLQHFPEDIPRFLAALSRGSDVVCGWRHERREGVIRRWPSRVANFLIRKITGVSIHDVGTTFRAYRREIVKDLRLLGENHRFVPVFARMVGARLDEITIQNVERPHGVSNYGISRTLHVFIDLFFLYFITRYADRPIRIFGKISLLLTTAGLAIAAALLTEWFLTGHPVVRERSGWFMLSALCMLTAVQVLLAGLLSELLAGIYFSKTDRRSYQVRREVAATSFVS
jgi:glycosyltransferase involved in cell wall biosynthesis